MDDLIGVEEKGEEIFLRLLDVDENGEGGCLLELKRDPLATDEEGVAGVKAGRRGEGEKEGEDLCLGDLARAVLGAAWITPLMVRLRGVVLGVV